MKLYKKVSDEYFEPATAIELAVPIQKVVIKYAGYIVPLDKIIQEVEKILGEDVDNQE